MPSHPEELIDLLEVFLLGSSPTLTGPEIADQVGIDMEVARERWRSLGFSAVDDEEVAFTEADLRAMQHTERLHELGLVDDTDEAALIRALGRSFARLAEWQLDLVGRSIDLESTDSQELIDLVAKTTPVIEEVMNYVWRRHLVAVGTRKLLAAKRRIEAAEAGPNEAGEDTGDDTGAGEWIGTPMAVGFADIVGYTKQSRELTQREIGELVDRFEHAALQIVSGHEGRIIKTIGDEILFVVDDPAAAARIALELTECHLEDEDFPELRVGIAYGEVLPRLGDVFGPTVNVASRLTGIARPGRVLCDRDLAEELEGDESFRLRRLRRTSVKGYRRLEPVSVRRPAAQDPHLDPDKQPGPASTFIAEQTQGILRSIHEMDLPGDRTIRGEAAK